MKRPRLHRCGAIYEMERDFHPKTRINPMGERKGYARHRMKGEGDDRMSFADLKQKDVINISDGRRLGKPIDVTFTENARIDAIVVPEGSQSLSSLFGKSRGGIQIPWERVHRIGDDVILVEIGSEAC